MKFRKLIIAALALGFTSPAFADREPASTQRLGQQTLRDLTDKGVVGTGTVCDKAEKGVRPNPSGSTQVADGARNASAG